MRAVTAPPRTTPTLLDVARHAGVSAATASRALNGHLGVSPDKVDRVKAAVRELGYIADATARTVSAGSSSTVAIVLVTSQPLSIELIRGAVAAAAEHDLTVLVAELNPDNRHQAAVVRRLRTQRPRSIIILGDTASFDNNTADEIAGHRRHGGHVSTGTIPVLLHEPAEAWWSLGQEAVRRAVDETRPVSRP